MKHIAELRKEADLTQSELATRLDISQQAISKYEKEERDPDIDVLIRIAKFFNVSTDYLLGLSDIKSSYGITAYWDKHPNFNETVGHSIRYWIYQSGHGDNEITEELGISEDLLEDYCSGMSMPLDILYKLSEVCGVSTDCLLGMREKSRPRTNGILPFKFDPEISLRLKKLAKEYNDNYSYIADIIGIDEEEVFNFFEYGFVLHIDIFIKIVEHFLVSSDYLLNRSDSTLVVQQAEERLLQVFRTLNDDSKIIALSKLLELKREDDLVAAKNHFLDDSGKSLPSNGTEGGTMLG